LGVHQHQPEFINIDQEFNSLHGIETQGFSVADIQRVPMLVQLHGATRLQESMVVINTSHCRAAPNGGRLYVAKLAYGNMII
jgi:hypothetical protein